MKINTWNFSRSRTMKLKDGLVIIFDYDWMHHETKMGRHRSYQYKEIILATITT